MGTDAEAAVETFSEGEWTCVALFPSLPRDRVFFTSLQGDASRGLPPAVEGRSSPEGADERTVDALSLIHI
jgi:hypothetical protein